jgi:nucleotidyltransferase substrate binding protein (TIGR01987 family)
MNTQRFIILEDIDITFLLNAQKTFLEALQEPKTTLTRDSTILRFFLVFETTWKTLKKILEAKGLIANNPRDVIREAAGIGLIEDPKQWFTFLRNRNECVRTYNELLAEQIYASLPRFAQELEILINKIKAL